MHTLIKNCLPQLICSYITFLGIYLLFFYKCQIIKYILDTRLTLKVVKEIIRSVYLIPQHRTCLRTILENPHFRVKMNTFRMVSHVIQIIMIY